MNIVIIFLAKYLIYILASWAIVASMFIVHKESWRSKIIWFAKILLSFALFAIVTEIFHLYFPTTRPYILQELEPLVYLPTSYSFPSGHAGQSAILASFIFSLNKSWGIVAFVLAGLVAAGRVLVGAHFVQDVLGGLIIGIIISATIINLSRRIS